MTRKAAQIVPESPVWQVLAALAIELHRQQHFGGLRVSKMDEMGRVRVEGQLDLAGVAHAAECGLRAAFETDEGTDDEQG